MNTAPSVSYQRMLAELRASFNARLPNGLPPKADARLQRTLSHWSAEVTRVEGPNASEAAILRNSYDSMVAWLHRNPHILTQDSRLPDIEAAVAPDTASQGLSVIGSSLFEGEVSNPLSLFKSIPLDSAVPVQPKDFLQRDESVTKYIEVEYNLFLNSKDRNWIQEVGQNRYNFTVTLNAGGRGRGTSAHPSIQNRFRNIVRLEFIKATLPVEALDLIVPKNCTDVSGNPVGNAFSSVLGLPFVTVVCDEHEGNNYGTADVIDKSLAVCQYDAVWRSNLLHAADNVSRGFTMFFPKLMKAQRVYAPTPLATFQQLTFQILNPENCLLSKAADVYTILGFFLSSSVAGTTCYTDTTGRYIFIQMSSYFPVWSFSQFDRVQFGGQTGTTAVAAEFIQWLQRAEGHVVIGTAYGPNISDIADGNTADGYANFIIIENRYSPPSAVTGLIEVEYFSGSVDGDVGVLQGDLVSRGKALNLNRQVQLALRVVCREKDPTTNLRPDNV